MVYNTLKNFILILAISAFVASVDAQVTCTSSSPQCCWLVRSWQLMGRSIPSGISPNDNSCCTKPMDGVACDSTKTKVTWIAWNAKSLRGSIPPEMGKLTSLAFLWLSDNQLSGSIPAEIGNWINMTYLNQLSGSIPSTIGNLVKLQYIYLYQNKLSGQIPSTIGNLVNLIELKFDLNQLSGQIPSTIGNLINLKDLWISQNLLSGSLPIELGNLTKLTKLNQLSGPILSWIGNLRLLEHLALRTNKLSGPIPTEIGNLINIIAIMINSNNLSGELPPSMRNLPKLNELSNPLLSGSFTPKCGMKVSAGNTNVTLCGCAASGSPPVLFPPKGTPLACLATGAANSLTRRIQVFSQNIAGFKFTCNKDSNSNPFQDCFNSVAAVCEATFINQNGKTICRSSVDSMISSLTGAWKNVRTYCGQWAYNGYIGSVNSAECVRANNALIANAYYNLPDGTKSYITSAFTNSVNALLWSNALIK